MAAAPGSGETPSEVNLRLREGTAPGVVAIQLRLAWIPGPGTAALGLSAAWINGPEVNIPVQ